MCLIHSIFPDKINGNTVYCSNAEQRLEAVKQYVLKRINTLLNIQKKEDLQNLNPKLTTEELIALQGLAPTKNALGVINQNHFLYDGIIQNLTTFKELLQDAQQNVQQIQTGNMNEGSLCYYIAQQYNIGIQLYNLTNGQPVKTRDAYNPKKSQKIVNIHGQQGHFEAMLTDDEFEALKNKPNTHMQPTQKQQEQKREQQRGATTQQKQQPKQTPMPKPEQERKEYLINFDTLNTTAPQINITAMQGESGQNPTTQNNNLGRYYGKTKTKLQESDIKTAITDVFAKGADKIGDDGKGKVNCFREIMQAIIEEKEKEGGVVGISEELSGKNAGFTAWQKEFSTKLEIYNKNHNTKYDISDMQKISASFQELSKDILDTAGGRHYENNGKEVQTGMRSYRAVQILSKIQPKSAQR